VRRPTAEAARGRDALAQREVHAVTGAPGTLQQTLRRAHGEVLTTRGHAVVTREHLQRDARRFGHRDRLEDVVGLPDRHGERLEFVKAVGAPEAEHPQRQRELGERCRADMPEVRGAHSVVPARANAAHCSSPSDSARARGSTPASVSASVVRSPSAGRNVLRNILRRWANPARTSSKSRSRDGTSTGGASRRTSSTSAESTFGTGTNTARGTIPTILASA